MLELGANLACDYPHLRGRKNPQRGLAQNVNHKYEVITTTAKVQSDCKSPRD